jgi:transaldolase/glucose-6-phosphate isomerase
MSSLEQGPIHLDLQLGFHGHTVEARLQTWDADGFLRRLWEKDPTLWSRDPVPEISDRLGWLDLPEQMEGQIGLLKSFTEEVRLDGLERVILLGMGGSSLTPEVFARTFSPEPGFPTLSVLDTTHPRAVRDVEASIETDKTLFLVSSKSGTTLETLSLFRYFWKVVGRYSKFPGRHFAAITDPGTPLESLARERDFRACFSANPEVGGRYSALSPFGLVPATLLGIDPTDLIESASHQARESSPAIPAPRSLPLALGAALGELALAGRDKATFLASPGLDALPVWIEQLVAESTGKDNKGIVPVADEPPLEPGAYRNDRFFIHIGLESELGADTARSIESLRAAGHPVARLVLKDRTQLGGAFFLLETAVAAAGAVLGIHPFNQPDVQLAKEMAQRAMAEVGGAGGSCEEVAPASPDHALDAATRDWVGSVLVGDYIALQAYLVPEPAVWEALQDFRRTLGARFRCATTSGYGPRFLHSTGQLHKGGPDSGLFLQIIDEPGMDLAVPESGFTFGALIRAQALGDLMALKKRGRRVHRVNLGANPVEGLRRLEEGIGQGS